MSEYQYEDDLRNALVKYGDAKNRESQAKEEKENLKQQIKEWMNINNLDGQIVFIEDDNGQQWKLDLSQERSNLKVLDWDNLYEELGDDKFHELVKTSKSNPFVITEKKK